MNRLLGVIENKGDNTLVDAFRAYAKAAHAIDIGVAYVTDSALTKTLFLTARKPTRFLTGLDQWFLSDTAIRRLFKYQAANPGFQVRIAPGRLHWKVYFFHGGRNSTAIIGSSNFTDSGLGQSGELNVSVSIPQAGKTSRSLHTLFEEQWNESFPLTAEVMERYIASRPRELGTKIPTVPRRAILGQRSDQIVRPPKRYWSLHFTGPLQDGTLALVEEKTDWSERGWLVMAGYGKDFRVGDQAVVFDFFQGDAYVLEVKQPQLLPYRTPHGSHLVAYRELPVSCPLGAPLWRLLKSNGLLASKDRAYAWRQLDRTRFDAIRSVLKGFS